MSVMLSELPEPWCLAGMPVRLRREAADPRAWQIVALALLLAWNITQLSMGADLVPSLVAIAATLATQVAIAPFAASPTRDLRSPLVTGLSLALLLRGDALWVPAAAGVVAIAAKFAIRFRGKHVFNPAAIAIVVLLASGHGWVSPGQWGQSALLVSAMMFLALLVLTRASRLDIALTFLVTHGALLTARAAWLGDPPAIPLHQLQNGALLLFAFFMITDPRTTPDARAARIFFAVFVAAAAHGLAFFEQMRPALYVALIAASPLVPLLDRIFTARRFVWRNTMEFRPCDR